MNIRGIVACLALFVLMVSLSFYFQIVRYRECRTHFTRFYCLTNGGR